MKSKHVLKVTVLICALVTGPIALAQQSSGTIVGTVSDATGAVVPGAPVALTNLATKQTREVLTNSAGAYSAPYLSPAEYEVAVELKGFKKALVRPVKLEVAQTKRVDLTLEVGEVTETVQVTSGTLRLETESPTLAHTITEQKIAQLPLNGRTFAQLALLVPGVNAAVSGSITVRRFRGSAGTPVAIQANGAAATQNKFTYDGVEAMDLDSYNFSFAPSLDAIQEFRVQTNSYSAESGGAPGAHVNLVTKAGTNAFHGGAWEFNRNDALAAQRAFTLTKQRLNRNQFGANLGGPIVRNKAFFFFNWEAGRQILDTPTSTAIVPPAAFRAGDFSSLGTAVRIIDPLSGQPFPNNVIPAQRIRAASRTYLEYTPLPNIDQPPFNFRSPPIGVPTNEDQYLTRIDYTVSPGDTLSGRYVFDKLSTDTTLPFFGNDQGTNIGRSQNLALTWTHTFSAAMVLEARAGWHRFFENEILGTSNKTEFDIACGKMNLPTVSCRPIDFGPPGISAGYRMFTVRTNGPRDRLNQLWDLAASNSLQAGNHSLRFGVNIYRRNWTFDEALVPRGTWTFDGRQTSDRPSPLIQHQFADFLLGRVNSVSINPDQIAVRMDPWSQGYYFQDAWRIAPRLTLNLGLRYDYFQRPRQRDDRMANFRFDNGGGFLASQHILPGEPGLGRSLVLPYKRGWGPRFGFAWTPVQQTVLRAGYGLYWTPEITNSFTLLAFNPPFTRAIDFSGTLQEPLQYDDPRSFDRPVVGAGIFGAFAVDPKMKEAYTQQWNFTVESDLPLGTLLAVSYVGSKGTNLTTGYQANRPIEVGDPRPIGPRRPLTTFGGITGHGGFGNSIYHSLQARVERRVATGLSILGAYTWSKALGNIDGNSFGGGAGGGSIQDIFNLRAERSYLIYDVPHRLSLALLYDLPQLNNARPAFRHAFGNWRVGAIITEQTGNAGGVSYGLDTTNTGLGSRPDQIAKPTLSRSERSSQRWLNTAAFVAPPAGRFGNAARNVFHQPGTNSVDFTVHRMFRIAERHLVEFRAELFNVFNHVNLGFVNGSIRSPAFGTINSAGDPRIVQFGLKYSF